MQSVHIQVLPCGFVCMLMRRPEAGAQWLQFCPTSSFETIISLSMELRLSRLGAEGLFSHPWGYSSWLHLEPRISHGGGTGIQHFIISLIINYSFC